MANLSLSLTADEFRRVAECARRANQTIEDFVSSEVGSALITRNVPPKPQGQVLTFQALKSAGRRQYRDK